MFNSTEIRATSGLWIDEIIKLKKAGVDDDYLIDILKCCDEISRSFELQEVGNPAKNNGVN